MFDFLEIIVSLWVDLFIFLDPNAYFFQIDLFIFLDPIVYFSGEKNLWMIVFLFVILERIVCFSWIQMLFSWTDLILDRRGCFSGYSCLFFKGDLCVYSDNCFLDRNVFLDLIVKLSGQTFLWFQGPEQEQSQQEVLVFHKKSMKQLKDSVFLHQCINHGII